MQSMTFLTIDDLNESSKRAGYRKRCYQFAIDYAKEKSIAGITYSNPRTWEIASILPFRNIIPPLLLDGKSLFIPEG